MVPKIPVSWGGVLGRNVRGPVFFNTFCKWEIIEIVLVTITCCSSERVAWVSCIEVRVGTLASVYCHYVSFVSIMAVLQGGETGCLKPHPRQWQIFLLDFLLISGIQQIPISTSDTGKLRPGKVGFIIMNYLKVITDGSCRIRIRKYISSD